MPMLTAAAGHVYPGGQPSVSRRAAWTRRARCLALPPWPVSSSGLPLCTSSSSSTRTRRPAARDCSPGI